MGGSGVTDVGLVAKGEFGYDFTTTSHLNTHKDKHTLNIYNTFVN